MIFPGGGGGLLGCESVWARVLVESWYPYRWVSKEPKRKSEKSL